MTTTIGLDLERRLIRAIADPGSFTRRIHTDFGDDRTESVPEWSGRAVLAALNSAGLAIGDASEATRLRERAEKAEADLMAQARTAEALRVNRDQLKTELAAADELIADLESAEAADRKRMYGAESEVERLRAAKAQLRTHQRFVDQIRELAWTHRDVDPFATVVLDEIRSFTNKQTEITK